MNILFLMKPYASINYEKDTSFILMKGAEKRGHNVYYLPQGGISIDEGKAFFDVEELRCNNPLSIIKKTKLTDAEVDVIFVRTDPPFDTLYQTDTLLLDRLPKHIRIVNSPNGLRSVNEKIFATQFSDLIPPTLITAKKSAIHAFLRKHGSIVLKPTNGFGGEGIFKLTPSSANINVICELLTHNETTPIIAQAFIEDAEEGDKRILLLEGEPLGALLRVHNDTDHRNNFFSGGHEQPCKITQRDHEIITAIKPKLLEYGLFFVGIDIIGNFLIEINITSPTCLQEMNRLYNVSLENSVIEALEKI